MARIGTYHQWHTPCAYMCVLQYLWTKVAKIIDIFYQTIYLYMILRGDFSNFLNIFLNIFRIYQFLQLLGRLKLYIQFSIEDCIK